MTTTQAVLDVIAKYASCDAAKLSRDAVLVDVGVSSLKFIQMLLEIGQVSGKNVMDINKIGTLKTVGDILQLAE